MRPNVLDACLAFAGPRFDGAVATHNHVVGNRLSDNEVNSLPGPFAFAGSDLALISLGEKNCFARNSFETSFSILGLLPACRYRPVVSSRCSHAFAERHSRFTVPEEMPRTAAVSSISRPPK